MNKIFWAAALAVSCLVVSHGRATAQSCCLNIASGFHVKICGQGFFKAWSEPFQGCAHCNGPAGCGGYGGGYAGGCPGNNCSGQVPGPWYTYWPYNGQPYMSSPYEQPGWVYESNFQVPAPVYPYWPAAANQPAREAMASAAGGFQPAGYYPYYWYGK